MAVCNEASTNVPVTTEMEVEGTSGKIEVNGVELYFERYGNGPHAILCIPGALGGSVFFTLQAKYFGQSGSRYTLIAYDPRGYGRSRPNDRVSLSPLFYIIDAKDATELMKAMGFKEYSILRWCDGGTCAIIAAAMFPEIVKSIVIWGTHTFLEQTDVDLFETWRNVYNWKNPHAFSIMEKYYGEEFGIIWKKWLDGFTGIYLDPVRQGDICKKEVKEVQCPTLVLHGDKDAVIPFYQIEFLQNNMQNCRCEIIPDGGHSLHMKYSLKFNSLVDEFLSK